LAQDRRGGSNVGHVLGVFFILPCVFPWDAWWQTMRLAISDDLWILLL
jgi:hypothetical protein